MTSKRKSGRPVGSWKKREGSHNPSTMVQKRKRGRPFGSGRKKKMKEEHADLGILLYCTLFMCHF